MFAYLLTHISISHMLHLFRPIHTHITSICSSAAAPFYLFACYHQDGDLNLSIQEDPESNIYHISSLVFGLLFANNILGSFSLFIRTDRLVPFRSPRLLSSVFFICFFSASMSPPLNDFLHKCAHCKHSSHVDKVFTSATKVLENVS